MRLPERIDTETELENILAEPSDADLACVARLTGDVLILGAGGKMGPSLARRVQRAVIANRQHQPCDRRLPLLVSRRARARLDAEGIRTVACDLLDPAGIAALPRCPYVLFLAGRKFGTLDRTDITWATNTVIPARSGRALLSITNGGVLDRQRLRDGARRRPRVDGRRPAGTSRRVRAIMPRTRARRGVRLARAGPGDGHLSSELRGGPALRHAGGHRPTRVRRRADRPHGRLLQRHLAGRREQLRVAQPRARLVAADDSQRHRSRTHRRSRDGAVVRRAFRPPASLREQRRSGRAAERFEPVPRAARRALRAARSPAAMGGALGTGRRRTRSTSRRTSR